MPKGKKYSKVEWQPQNGRRAVAGKWGDEKKLNSSQFKEQLKKDQKILHLQQQHYIKNNIQTTNENLQIENKE